MPADGTVVLVNARVWPAGDRLAVTGAVIGPPDADGERIDLGGATVVPGLVDAHVHFPSWALGRRELRLFGTRSLSEALERVEAAEKPADRLAARPRLARGGVAGGRAADAGGARRGDRRRSDRAARPRRAHAVGQLGRPAGSGGQTAEGAARAPGASSTTTACCASTTPWDFFDAYAAATPAETLDAVRDALPAAHAAGVTGVHDKDGARGAPEAFAALREAGELSLRVWQSVPDADAARGSYVKAFMDGTLGSRTALLLGGGGMRLMGPEGLAAVIRDAAAAGMPVAVHAIGDLANREALDAFAATQALWHPLGLRHRVEHAQCVHPDDIARYARLGITASVQYTHATSDRALAARLWADRLDHAYPYRQLLDAGVRLAGGSDAPVEDLDPLAGLRAAAECGVSFEEALASFTAAPAWLEGAEQRRGRLSEGFDADLVVLDGDRVRATMVAGRWVHGQP